VTAERGFGPVADYLPHRPPMLLIDEIVEVTQMRAVCRTTIHPDCVFAIDGRVHPSALIEFVAQVCAIGVGVLAARDGDPPRTGVILSCREISFGVDDLAVGDELTIVSNKVFGQKQMAAFACTVSRGDTLCATIQLSVADAALASLQLAGGDAGADAGDGGEAP
jgi:predicted hotdog family 3-hydroxylacyl-ACP dehydratase